MSLKNAVRLMTRVVGIAGIVLVSGCAVFAPEPRSIDPRDVPQQFELYGAVAPAPERWWTEFGSGELNALMDRILTGNLTIAEAYARLVQVEAAAVKAGALRWPELSASGGYTRSRQRVDLDSEMDGTTDSDRYSAGLSVTAYEIDLWGRVRSTHEAARLDAMVSVEDLRTAYLSVTAEAVSRWIELLVEREILHLLENQREANRQSLSLMEARFKLGQSSALDVYQQRQTVAGVEALIPGSRSRIRELQNEIAVLTGMPVGAVLDLEQDTLPEMIPVPDPGLPADILSRRPDVRRAGLALAAADWRVSAARADRLPALRLTASMSYGAEDLDRVFTNWIASLAAGLTGPVFDAGRRRAEVDRTRAVAEEKLAVYRATVLDAVLEVQNALIRRRAEAETVEAQMRQLEAARATYRESLDRYRKGTIEYLPVLTALTQSQSLERTLLRSRFSLFIEQINMYRALGGPLLETYRNNEISSTDLNQTQGEI
ncbi:MAG TPA: efflux transporter outer membrane subunit [bacterium]|nr:efflux transporter outer membrane subunit [bacterium]